MGSFPQPWTLPPPISAAAMALVRGITDDRDRRSARRQGVLGARPDARAPARRDLQAAGPGPKQIVAAVGVTVARISQIEHGEVTSFEVIAGYLEALGRRLDLVASFGDRTIRLPISDTATAP